MRYGRDAIATIKHGKGGVETLAIRNSDDTGWVCSFASGHVHDDETSPVEVVQIRQIGRISEPMLWGVVEAQGVGENFRRFWVRHDRWGNALWWPLTEYSEYSHTTSDHQQNIMSPRLWESLVDPVLVREGIES